MLPLAIHWNVDPVLFHIGGFGLRWYSLCFLVAFLLGYYIIERMFKREGVKEDYLSSLFLYIFLAILFGARLGHCLFYEPDYFLTSEHWVEIFWPFQNGHFTGFQGLASHGAAIGILVSLWLYWRKYGLNPWWFLDRLVIVVALGGAFVRLGNLFNSEIYGVETTLPWGFIFEREGEVVAKHPTQLYESLSYFIIFGVSYWYYLRKNGRFKTGTIFGWWLVALFGARFLIEFVKTNGVIEGSALLMGQWLSIPFIVGGLVIAWLAAKEKLPQGAFPKGEKIVKNNGVKRNDKK
jgi:prolipoprotein diacylglyceryl transferase